LAAAPQSAFGCSQFSGCLGFGSRIVVCWTRTEVRAKGVCFWFAVVYSSDIRLFTVELNIEKVGELSAFVCADCFGCVSVLSCSFVWILCDCGGCPLQLLHSWW
jgi:hypothetical protein